MASLADDPYARAFRDQLERVKPTPKVPEWERIADEIRPWPSRSVHGGITIDEARSRELDARTDRDSREAPLDARAARRSA